MCVRKPIIALLICTRLGVSGPSEDTAPLQPCAEMLPTAFEIKSPVSTWNANSPAGLARSPMRVR